MTEHERCSNMALMDGTSGECVPNPNKLIGVLASAAVKRCLVTSERMMHSFCSLDKLAYFLPADLTPQAELFHSK